jgi:putative flippase GtrA
MNDLVPPDPRPGLAAHGMGFLASGLTALAVDMGVLSVLTRVVGVSAFIARPIGIMAAMIAGWLCHRTLTFSVQSAPRLAEFMKYAAVAWGAAAVNYALYAGLLVAIPGLPPEAALCASSAVAMFVSYVGMRFGVFKN